MYDEIRRSKVVELLCDCVEENFVFGQTGLALEKAKQAPDPVGPLESFSLSEHRIQPVSAPVPPELLVWTSVALWLADLMASTTVALTVSRKQRLRELEKEIRSGMEEFYYTGMKLKEIRDDELYKEDGFETWEKYCREQWEWEARYVKRLITASEYREKFPSGPTGTADWSERSVRELTRIPDKKQAARVAAKAVNAIEQSEKEAAKNPGAKPIKLSSSTIKRFVDEDLGVKSKPKEKPKQQKNGIDLSDDPRRTTLALLSGED